MLALRSNVQFSSKARLVHAPRSVDHPLTRGVQELRERLCDPLRSHVAPGAAELLKPFIGVACSGETTEPITGVALAAFVAFLELKCTFLDVAALTAMSQCARESRSEVMDPQTHEAIVARVLQIYVGCVRHPAGRGLSEESIIGMLRSAFNVSVQAVTTSELLRRTAEQAMNDMVAACFGYVADGSALPDAGSYGAVMAYVAALASGDAVAARTGRISPTPAAALGGGGSPPPEGNPQALKHRVVVVSGGEVPSVQLLGLCLAHTALFVVEDRLSDTRCKPLLSVVANDLARALLRVGRHSDNVVVLAQMLRTMHLLVSFASTMVIPQLLSFLKVVHLHAAAATVFDLSRCERDELLFESLLEFAADPALPAFLYYHYDLSLDYERVLEPLCSFLSRACSALPGGAPTSDATGPDVVKPINQTNVLALESLLAMMSALASRLEQQGATEPPEALSAMVAKKDVLLTFSEKLADAPKQAVRVLLESEARFNHFGLKDKVGPAEMARFLAQHHTLLDKAGLADYLSELGKGPPKPDDRAPQEERDRWDAARVAETETIGTIGYHMKLLAEYMTYIPLRGRPLIASIRETVAHMGMPRESQKIDRVMEEFAKAWFAANQDAPRSINPFAVADGAFVLSFSLMMLNTDLHSGKIDKTMSADQFVSLNRGINGGADLPEEYLRECHAEVKSNKIELIDVVSKGFDDDATWLSEMHEGRVVAATHGSAISLRRGDPAALASYDRPVFDVIWRPCVAAFSSVLDAAGSNLTAPPAARTVEDAVAGLQVRDVQMLEVALEGLKASAVAAHRLQDHTAVDHIVVLLLRFLPLHLRDAFQHMQIFGRSPKCLLVSRLVFDLLHTVGDSINGAWSDAGVAVAKLLLLGVFAEDDIGSPLKASGSGTDRDVTAATSGGAFERAMDGEGQRASASSSSTSPPKAPERLIVPATLVTNPRIAVPPENDGSDGGWLGLFSAGSADKRRQRDMEDHHALLRVRSAAPSLSRVLRQSSEMKPEALRTFLAGVMSVCPIGPTMTVGDAYVASFVVQLVAEVVVHNVFRLRVASGLVSAYLGELLSAIRTKATVALPHNADPAQLAASAHWRDAWTRCLGALNRLVVFLAQRKVDAHASLVLLAATAHALQSKGGAEFAAPLALALDTLVSDPDTARALTADEWDRVLQLLVVAGRDAPCRQVRERAGAAALTIAKTECYVCPDNVAALAETLAAFAHQHQGPQLPSDEDLWVRLAPPSPPAEQQEDEEEGRSDTNTAESHSRVDESTKVPGRAAYQDKYVGACTAAHNRLMKLLAEGEAPEGPASVAWLAAWRHLLQCSAAVCIGSVVTDPKLCSDSLLFLQRCVLDPLGPEHLNPGQAHEVFTHVVLPLTEKICVRGPAHSPAAQSPAGGSGRSIASLLSPSTLLATVFTVTATQPSPASSSSSTHTSKGGSTPAAGEAAVHFPEELQARTASMLPKAVLHLLTPLASEHRLFMPLWQRVMSTLYALYTAPTPPSSAATNGASTDGGLLREAVMESVRNLVYVLATTASQSPEQQLLFTPFPTFWSSTQKLLRSFDFAQPLLAHLDTTVFAATDAEEASTR